MSNLFELANNIQPAMVGFKRCGCCVAVDLDALATTVDEWKRKGYEIRTMMKADAISLLKSSFCQHN